MDQGLKLAGTGTRRRNFVLEAAKSLPLPDDLLRQKEISFLEVQGSQCIDIRAIKLALWPQNTQYSHIGLLDLLAR
jgi:hypothetical protein